MKNMDETDLKKLMDYDPIGTAEKMTGKSWKEDESVTWLGMALGHEHGKKKDAALAAAGDATFMCSLEDYLKVIQAIGFALLLKDEFDSASSGSKESNQVWWHTEGILLHFDTYYGETHVNGGKFCYNWKPKTENWYEARVVSSGGLNKAGIWSGDHDCREGIKTKIALLRKHGDFVMPWVEQPFLWLLHHEHTKVVGYDYQAITQEIISRLPKKIQSAITPKTKP